MKRTYHRVAPADTIRKDFQRLDSLHTLRAAWSVEQLILLQSVLGHVHEGHGVFRGERYPNTSMDDIVRALRLGTAEVRQERQGLIDGIAEYVGRALAGSAPATAVDEEGTPCLTFSPFRHMRVDPAEVLAGIFVGGLRDDIDVRREAEERHGVRLGGGRSYLVDRDRMEEMHVSGEDLARGEWETQIDWLRDERLIVEPGSLDEPRGMYQYIRHRRGCGASDDAAIVVAGLLWGLGVAVGVFLADAIDTIEKYVPAYHDQDLALALRVERELASLHLTRDDAVRLAWLAASDPDAPINVPDSSLRHLLAVDRHTDLCAIEAHLLEVQGMQAPPVLVGHERVSSRRFYEYVRNRVSQA
ncbi:MAG TPA: hypothetical protein VLH79_11110 [Chthonomonadales bacterium]|nr:hypothetical protein [Chthonomonadales bacterium]